jgi:SAM-dependent methyltransferase
MFLGYHAPMPEEYYYDEAIAARYDLMVPAPQVEIDFYLELAREAQAQGLRTLEPTCGTGRVTIPLAQAGIRMVGLDISPAMLAVGRERSGGLDIEWVEGDMRSFELGEQFGLAMIPVGSFQLLLEVEDQLACLRCIHRHLAPGGRLAFEVENPDPVRMADWLTTKRGTLVRNPARDYVEPESGRRVLRWDGAEYHPSEQRYVSTWLREELDDDGNVVRRMYGKPLTVRYFYRYEMEHLLASAGFEIEALYGDVAKSPYTSRSPDFIWVARRG